MRRLALVLIVSLASSSLYADSKKLTEDQRIEILRGLNFEYAKIKVPLPRSKSALEVTTSGTRDEAKWAAAQKENGPAGRVGDLIQVTRVDIGKDRIVLDLNGGIKGGRRFLDFPVVASHSERRASQRGGAPGGRGVSDHFEDSAVSGASRTG